MARAICLLWVSAFGSPGTWQPSQVVPSALMKNCISLILRVRSMAPSSPGFDRSMPSACTPATMELVPESMLTVGGFGGGGDSPVGVVELGRGGGVAGVAGAPPHE